MIGSVVERVQSVADLARVVLYEGSEGTVPDAEDVAKIRIGPGPLEVVVKFVHVRRDEHQRNDGFDGFGQTDVGVGQHRKQHAQNAVDQVESQRHARQHNGDKRKHFANEVVARVVPDARGGIDLGIAVVYHMKTPHPGKAV